MGANLRLGAYSNKYGNHSYEIVMVWGDRTTGNMDPCVLMILFYPLHYKSTQEQAKREVFPKVLLFVPRINYDNYFVVNAFFSCKLNNCVLKNYGTLLLP